MICRNRVLGKPTEPRPGTDKTYYNQLNQEIDEVKMMCNTNMGGYWELAHLPYSGGFYEQPADLIESIMEIIRVMNNAIYNDKDDK